MLKLLVFAQPMMSLRGSADLEKTTVSEIFALQLMQVPQVTEEAALAVIELYPTPFFLAQAYSTLVGPICSLSL